MLIVTNYGFTNKKERRLTMRTLDKFKGCMIGGAVGDALGYAVEFLREDAIFRKYAAEYRKYQLMDRPLR